MEAGVRVMKKLEEMSLEELWQLFPIELSKPQACWKDWYKEEKAKLLSLLAGYSIQIEHVGSTAIEGIEAKPIVDILVLVKDRKDLRPVAEILVKNAYRLMNEQEARISLNKGYSEFGYEERVFHIHLHVQPDSDEILFRDFLNSHPEKAKEYESLKKKLAEKFQHDRDEYTRQKSDFVQSVLKKARS